MVSITRAVALAAAITLSGVALAQTAAVSNNTTSTTTIKQATPQAAALIGKSSKTTAAIHNAAVTTKSSKKSKDADPSVRPDDPNKNPYWEPRDWTYINSNTP